MSADNYYKIVPHPDGGYAAVMGFMSYAAEPEVTAQHESFPTLMAAFRWASDQGAEYGVVITETATEL